jgi:predicted ATPase
MNPKNPGLALLDKRIDELGLRREIEEEIAQISLEHKSPVKRYILTGTPGCGKTSILRSLELAGYAVIEEAATDIIALRHAQGIAEPWKNPTFIDDITNLQKHRQMRIADVSGVQFYDRSPLCTYALAAWLNFPISKTLAAEMARIEKAQIFQKQVFFIENLGFCAPTAARKITFEDSLKFEKVHEETYRSFGYECIRIAPRDLSTRVEQITRYVSAAD